MQENLQKALFLIEQQDIAQFFQLLKSCVGENAMISRLEKGFILGKTDADFNDQLRALAQRLLEEEPKQLQVDYQVITEKIKTNRGAGTEEILKNKTVDDLDEKTVKNFFDSHRVKFILPQETTETEQTSIHSRFLQLSLAENGHLFKGTFFCLGKRNQIFSLLPSAAESKFIYFAGTQRTDEIRILEDVWGNVVQQYEKMVFIVERNIGRGRKRETNEDVPEIPLIAIREFLANAYVHRAYNPDIQYLVQVELYVDRLEINSPGHFPKQVNIQNVRQSFFRNPSIALIFSLFQYIEKGGTGIAKAQNELKRYGHPPAEIEELTQPDAIRVRLWKKKDTFLPSPSLEDAFLLLAENRISDFFEWAEKIGEDAILQNLKKEFLEGKPDVFFKEKLKMWARGKMR